MTDETFESKSREWIIFVVTTMIIGFFIGLVNVALGNILKETPYLFNLQLLLLGIGVIGIVVYLSFIFMVPSIHVLTNVNCKLLYNSTKGEFLFPSIYLNYYFAQEAAEQSIRRSSITNISLKQGLKKDILNAELDSEILNQLLEYLVIRWLNRSSTTILAFGSKTRILNYDTFPCWLKDNDFTHIFHESKSNDVVDVHLREMIVSIPPEFNLVSTLEGNNIRIEGKQAKVLITYSTYSIWFINYIDHKTHSIDSILINESHENELQDQLRDLRLVSIIFSFDATIPRWRSIFKRNDFIFFLNWCRELQNDFENFFHIDLPNYDSQ